MFNIMNVKLNPYQRLNIFQYKSCNWLHILHCRSNAECELWAKYYIQFCVNKIERCVSHLVNKWIGKMFRIHGNLKKCGSFLLIRLSLGMGEINENHALFPQDPRHKDWTVGPPQDKVFHVLFPYFPLLIVVENTEATSEVLGFDLCWKTRSADPGLTVPYNSVISFSQLMNIQQRSITTWFARHVHFSVHFTFSN